MKFYVAKINNLISDKKLCDYYLEYMPTERKEKVIKISNYSERVRSIASWALLLKALEDENLSTIDKTLNYSDNGKPYFMNEPTIKFNMSHSEDMVLCIINTNSIEVGCDIQKIKPANINLINKHFSENEKKVILDKKSIEEKDREFTHIWTLKESYVKAIGLGLKMKLESFDTTFPIANYTLRSKFVGDNYYAAYAINSKVDIDLNLIQVDI